MTQNNKPEWFEITDADEKPALRKVSKSLPVSAVLVAALILGVGVVMAQTQGITPLSALNTNATQTTQPESNATAQSQRIQPPQSCLQMIAGMMMKAMTTN
jgi:flagellar biogenesis protein FliO